MPVMMELIWGFLCFSKHTLIFMLKLWAISSTSPSGSCFKGTVAHILFLVLLICYLLMLTLKFRATFDEVVLSSCSQCLPALKSCTRPTCTLHSSHVQHELFLKAMMLFKFAKQSSKHSESTLLQWQENKIVFFFLPVRSLLQFQYVQCNEKWYFFFF